MSKTALVFLVILITSLPLVPAWFFFRRLGVNARWFLVCLGAGFFSVLIVLIVNFLIPASAAIDRSFFLYIFVRIALTEELIRLLVLFPVLSFVSRKRGADFSENRAAWGGTAGLIAGLGFAAAESAFYAGADYNIALLRAFSAAPLHAACGARIGTAFAYIRSRPMQAAFLLLSAVLIHGMYDFFILNPNMSSFLSLFIALAALGASFLSIINGKETLT